MVALTNSAVDRIVLAVAGSPYELTSNMIGCDSGLCIDRALTVEAEVAGQVVLDGMGERQVLYVSSSGLVELIGLGITGGYGFFGGGLYVDGTATLTNTNVYTNQAQVRARLPLLPGSFPDLSSIAPLHACREQGAGSTSGAR